MRDTWRKELEPPPVYIEGQRPARSSHYALRLFSSEILTVQCLVSLDHPAQGSTFSFFVYSFIYVCVYIYTYEYMYSWKLTVTLYEHNIVPQHSVHFIWLHIFHWRKTRRTGENKRQDDKLSRLFCCVCSAELFAVRNMLELIREGRETDTSSRFPRFILRYTFRVTKYKI